MAYSAIGESVPKNLWITYFNVKEDGKIDMKGMSENVDVISVCLKKIKDYLTDSQLRLYKLEMQSESIDDAVVFTEPSFYEFEITNMSEGELNTSGSTAAKSTTAKPAEQNSTKVPNIEPKTTAKPVNALEPINIDSKSE